MLSVTNLSFTYRQAKVPALSSINIEVAKGEILGIVGPNGAGKTTFCLCANGLVPNSVRGKMDGRVVVDGSETRTTPMHELAKRVGIVLQNPEAQFFGETVEEEVAFGPENLGLPQMEIRRRIDESLELVGMAGYSERYPLHLSGGQKQRVAIAIALAMRPDILVLDEPTSELDPVGKLEVVRTIEKLNRESGRTVILVTHETDELLHIAHRVAVLSPDGNLEAIGEPRDVLSGDLPEKVGIRQPQLFSLWNRLGLSADKTNIPKTAEAALSQLGGCRIESIGNAAPLAVAPPIIRCRSLTHVYTNGVRALDSVDVDIRRGEFVAVMGQNGSGKTTLTKHFNCLLRPTSGEVLVDDVDVAGQTTAEMSRRIGYAFQNPDHQLFAQTVAEEFAFGLRNIGVPESEIEVRSRTALNDSGLSVGMEDYPHFLGKGERQKLALATIMAMQPEILIIDEPTTGQDWRSASGTMDTLRRINAMGRTVIIVTHDTRLAAEYASRVIVMAKGRVVGDGPPAKIFYDKQVMATAFLRPPPIVELAAGLARSVASPGILSVDQFVESFRPAGDIRP